MADLVAVGWCAQLLHDAGGDRLADSRDGHSSGARERQFGGDSVPTKTQTVIVSLTPRTVPSRYGST
jgi:hypothetical protein